MRSSPAVSSRRTAGSFRAGRTAHRRLQSQLARLAHRFDRRRCAPAGEHRQPPEQCLLCLAEKVVSSIRPHPQRPLTFRAVTPAGEERQTTVEARQQLLRLEQPDPRGRQLEGQREPVQPPADLRHRRGLSASDRSPGGRACPLHEQRHRPTPRGSLEPKAGSRRHRQRRDGEPVLPSIRSGSRLVTSTVSWDAAPAAQPTTGAASTICSKLSSTSSMVRWPRWAVERVEDRSGRSFAEVERGRDGGDHQVGTGDRRQRDEVDPATKRLDAPGSDLDRQPRLARAARPGEGHQPAGAQQTDQLLPLLARGRQSR